MAFHTRFPFLFPLSCLLLSVLENVAVILHLIRQTSNRRSHQYLMLETFPSGIFKKWTGQSFGPSPAEVQMGQHMEAISGPSEEQRKAGRSLSSEPFEDRPRSNNM